MFRLINVYESWMAKLDSFGLFMFLMSFTFCGVIIIVKTNQKNIPFKLKDDRLLNNGVGEDAHKKLLSFTF